LSVIFGFLSESNSAQGFRVRVLNSDIERQSIFSEGIEPEKFEKKIIKVFYLKKITED
jgi:hypothetical protein